MATIALLASHLDTFRLGDFWTLAGSCKEVLGSGECMCMWVCLTEGQGGHKSWPAAARACWAAEEGDMGADSSW